MTHHIPTIGQTFRCLTCAGVLLVNCPPLAAQDITPPAPLTEELRPIRLDTVDGRFFRLLDLDAPGLGTTRRLVQKKDYGRALEAWRNYVVTKLRKRTVGKMGWHHNRLNGSFAPKFRIVLGREKDRSEPEDTAGIIGPPGKGKTINWLDPHARFRECYPGSRTMNSMVAYYQQSRDPAYVAKWFEIVDDFCVNQKRLEETLPLEQRTRKLTYPRSRNRQGVRIQWYLKSHQITLDAAGRGHNLLKGLAYFAKALPDGYKVRDWNKESMHPINTPLARNSLELIPAGAVADIALSLLYDHAPFLLDAYGKPGRTPNQRFSGLTALAGMASTFDEFRAGRQLARTAGACLENYVATTVLPDGGDLEQSFNYNKGLIKESLEIISVYPKVPDRPNWVRVLHDAALKRERLFAGVTSPLGSLPRTGTYAGHAPPAVWRDSRTRKDWQENVAKGAAEMDDDPVAQQIYGRLLGSQKSKAPSFTSVAFPYSGYYAQRDGWNMKSLYLWLIGSRRGRGHQKENINGIAVTAYGRNLITDNGPPPYTPDHLDRSQRSAYKEIKGYFGETSSLTSNTILVDMKSQRRHCVSAPNQAYQTPIASRWHTSQTYDFAESRYEDGYGGGGWKSPASIKVKHYRQVVFLRKHGFWLVTDRLVGDGKPRDYQQQWHFPPPHKQWNVQSPGFLDSQVVTDSSASLIRTTDPDGPNIALRHFSPTKIEYRRYHGHKKPWLGWYAVAIGGKRIPSVDVHACWRADGDSIVTTALVPSPNDKDLVREATDLSRPDGSVAGCRLVLADGAEVTWLAAQDNATLQIDNLTARAEALLLVKGRNRSLTGIAVGVKSIRLANKAFRSAPTDFEFAVKNNALRVIAPIQYPEAPDTVSIRPDHGLFVKTPVQIDVIPPGRPGAELRYTLDGSIPSATSTLTTGPIKINANAELIVRPFRNGKPSGDSVGGRFEIRTLPPKPPPARIHLADLEPTRVKVGAFALTRNRCCYQDRPLKLSGRTYQHGIGVHANAEIVYSLKPEYRRFVAMVGLDDVTGEKGNVVFKVLADGTLLSESPLLEGRSQRFWYLDCALPRYARQLQLKVEAGPFGAGWCMADWIDAGFIADAL